MSGESEMNVIWDKKIKVVSLCMTSECKVKVGWAKCKSSVYVCVVSGGWM